MKTFKEVSEARKALAIDYFVILLQIIHINLIAEGMMEDVLEFIRHDSLQFTLILKRNVLVYLNLQQKMQRRDHASCFV